MYIIQWSWAKTNKLEAWVIENVIGNETMFWKYKYENKDRKCRGNV